MKLFIKVGDLVGPMWASVPGSTFTQCCSMSLSFGSSWCPIEHCSIAPTLEEIKDEGSWRGDGGGEIEE